MDTVDIPKVLIFTVSEFSPGLGQNFTRANFLENLALVVDQNFTRAKKLAYVGLKKHWDKQNRVLGFAWYDVYTIGARQIPNRVFCFH